MTFQLSQSEQRPREKGTKMRGWKALLGSAALAVSLAAVPTPKADAQIHIGINLGGPPPACRWGYYDYAPYGCAPAGYYGPGYFYNGIFLGVGPWSNWGYAHGWGGHRFSGAGGGHYVPHGGGGAAFHGGGAPARGPVGHGPVASHAAPSHGAPAHGAPMHSAPSHAAPAAHGGGHAAPAAHGGGAPHGGGNDHH